MDILKPRFLIFFIWVFIIPATVAYVAGWDRSLDYLFFLKAFAIAFIITVAYYMLEKNRHNRSK